MLNIVLDLLMTVLLIVIFERLRGMTSANDYFFGKILLIEDNLEKYHDRFVPIIQETKIFNKSVESSLQFISKEIKDLKKMINEDKNVD